MYVKKLKYRKKEIKKDNIAHSDLLGIHTRAVGGMFIVLLALCWCWRFAPVHCCTQWHWQGGWVLACGAWGVVGVL